MSSAVSSKADVPAQTDIKIAGTMPKAVPVPQTPTEFGARLRRLRAKRSITQEELGRLTGLSRRMVIYYETQGGSPSPDLLQKLAKILAVSVDELLAGTPARGSVKSDEFVPRNPAELRLWRRFRQLQKLPAVQRRAVFHIIDGVLAGRAPGDNDNNSA